MSVSIVRKALKLFEDDFDHDFKINKKKTISTTKKHGIKMERLEMKNKTTLKNKKVKSVVEEYLKRKSSDRTVDNLKFIRQLAALGTNSKATEVLESQAKDRPPQDNKSTETVFIDEDFERFEREYNLA